MRHEGKLGKCQHLIVRKSVGVLELVGKSNKEEKYTIFIYERVIEGIGRNVFFEGTSWMESVMEWSNRFIEKMVRIDARIIRFKGDNEVLWRLYSSEEQ